MMYCRVGNELQLQEQDDSVNASVNATKKKRMNLLKRTKKY